MEMTRKDRIKNFWYYHKKHVFVCIFFGIFVIMNFVECMNNKTPDISIAYVSSEYREHAVIDAKLNEIIGDVNDDGVVYPFFDSVVLSPVMQMEGDVGLVQKVAIMFASGEYQLFIMDKEYFEADIYGETFTLIGDYISDEMAEDAVKMKGKPVAIKTTHSAFLNEMGICGDNLYVGVMDLLDSQRGKKEEEALHAATLEFFKTYIVGDING